LSVNEANDAHALHARLSQANDPVRGADALSGRCFSVQYRAPLEQLAGILPPGLGADQIGRSRFGLLSVLVSNATALRLGPLRVPGFHACALISRVAVRAVWEGEERRADWVMLAESSPRGLGRFSSAPRFEVEDDGAVWSLRCTSRDPLGGGWFSARTTEIDKETPPGSVFSSAREADELGLETQGICDYDVAKKSVSFRPVESIARDVSFCHDFDCEFALVRHLTEDMGVALELDSAVLVRDIKPLRQTTFTLRPDLGRFSAGAEAGASS
jgi:hypothetical protein